jgi:ferredoxin
VTPVRLDRLKQLRVLVALSFFIPTSILFLDPRSSIPPWASAPLVSLQLIPSLTKLLVYGGLTALGLVVVLALTIAFGRVYCSTLCPLGTLQDLFIRAAMRINRRRRFRYKKPHFLLHYMVFGAAALWALAGSMTLLNLLEPMSNYGRLLTTAVEPVVILLNNLAADVLGLVQVYALYAVPFHEFSASVLLGSLLFAGVIAFMSLKHGRLFCNTLCPAGALLGIISRVSLYRIIIDEGNCNECGACERVCKASCIEAADKRIDYSACVGCFNCITSCPTGGVTYARVLNVKKPAAFRPERREFFRDLAAPALGLALPRVLGGDTAASVQSGFEESRKHPITPPGSKSVERFSRLCTACHLCISACPTQVLAPSFLEYGIGGIFQPKMSYMSGYCNYECTVCTQVCPTGAILPVDVAAKKEIQIGKAVFVKDDCIVVANKKDCAACAEHCPTKAVKTVPYEGKLSIPELNNDICVGCGACEHACPTTPRKAIYVNSNPVHLRAKKPEVKKSQDVFDSTKDFPF